ncbi:MAG: hypothetical protein RMY34_33375 [Aulosira sp. DedQUE10]|nr:hypothetical protein [Aulosira sp. DedQUE10]
MTERRIHLSIGQIPNPKSQIQNDMAICEALVGILISSLLNTLVQYFAATPPNWTADAASIPHPLQHRFQKHNVLRSPLFRRVRSIKSARRKP